MTKERKIQVLLLAIALIISCFLTCFTSTIGSVYASTIDVVGGYTNVLDDLQTDPNFDANDYPIKENDYSLSVIQLAESSDKEIFVYVYQPNEEHGKYVASTINISLGLHDKSKIKNYKLRLLNYDGVFQKYVVNDLKAQDGDIRYYDVVSIFRVWDERIDEGLEDGNENTIDEVVFRVAQQYTIQTSANGDVNISMTATEFETIEVTSKYVGFMRYKDGWHFFPNNYESCDSHFVAFSTDKPIDKLYEVDITYSSQTYLYGFIGYPSYTFIGPSYFPENPEDYPQYVYLNYKDHGSYKGDALISYSYDWEVIQSVDEFLADENENRDNMYSMGLFNVGIQNKITDEGYKDIESKQWVVRFAETEYSKTTTTDSWSETYTIIGDVSLLRLSFETDGVYYDLPVVDNKQTGSLIPDNKQSPAVEPDWDLLEIILMILLIILLLVIIGPFIPTILNIVVWVLKIIIKVAWWIICLPFKLIKALYKKRE